MKIFRWNKPKPTTDYPLGLTKEQISLLIDLTSDSRFSMFTNVLVDIVELQGELLIRQKDIGDFRERQGYIHALRDIIELIPTLEARTEQLDESRRTAATRSDNGVPNPRSVFGGPWFDVFNRSNPSS